MSSIVGTVNGHSVEWTKMPAWSQDNSYLLYQVYREVIAVNARFPLAKVTIDRVSTNPPHYHALIDVLTNGDWTMHIILDDPLNPKFGIEETAHTTWRWNLVEATRGLRSSIVELLIANPSMIDSCSLVIVP